MDGDTLLLAHSRLDLGLPGFPSVSPLLPECSHTPHSVVISPRSPGVCGSFSSVFGFLYNFGSLKYRPVIPENSPSLGLFWLLSCLLLGLQQWDWSVFLLTLSQSWDIHMKLPVLLTVLTWLEEYLTGLSIGKSFLFSCLSPAQSNREW